MELERIDQEVTVEIEGFGLSLVNNITQTDVMYLGITRSEAIQYILYPDWLTDSCLSVDRVTSSDYLVTKSYMYTDLIDGPHAILTSSLASIGTRPSPHVGRHIIFTPAHSFSLRFERLAEPFSSPCRLEGREHAVLNFWRNWVDNTT